LQNGTWSPIGSITQGFIAPDGVFISSFGPLIATDYDAGDAEEFKKGSSVLWYTYSSGLVGPIVVSGDTTGHIAIGDYNDGADGHVSAFDAGAKTPIVTCGLAGGVEGVAYSPDGDTFISRNVRGFGEIRRFHHGFGNGCMSSAMAVTLASSGEMVMDRYRNIIIADQGTGLGEDGEIDIIKRPYASISKTLTGLAPFGVGLDQAEDLLFVTEPTVPHVKIFSYPAGSLLKTLDSSNGVNYTLGVSDLPNAVF